MTSEEWMAYYGSEDGITESKKVSKKQLDKAIDALNKATKDLTIVLPKWQEARDKGDDQAQSTYLEELRDLTKKKQSAEKLVNQHIKDLDKDAELKITAESLLEDGIIISEGFTSKLNQIRKGAKNVGDFIKKTLSDAEFKMFGGNQKFELFLTDFYKVATESVEEGKKGLWANVHAKRKRGEKPAKPGDEDYPDEEAWKDAQESLDVNEGVFTIAGGVVLGILGSIFAYKGLQAAKAIGGAIIDNSIESLMDYKDKLDDEKKFKNKIKPVADRFAGDTKLAAMYDELPPYIDSWSDKATKNNRKRTKAMQDIAKYIKSKLSEDEEWYFKEISQLLRTGKTRVGKNTFEEVTESYMIESPKIFKYEPTELTEELRKEAIENFGNRAGSARVARPDLAGPIRKEIMDFFANNPFDDVADLDWKVSSFDPSQPLELVDLSTGGSKIIQYVTTRIASQYGSLAVEWGLEIKPNFRIEFSSHSVGNSRRAYVKGPRFQKFLKELYLSIPDNAEEDGSNIMNRKGNQRNGFIWNLKSTIPSTFLEGLMSDPITAWWYDYLDHGDHGTSAEAEIRDLFNKINKKYYKEWQKIHRTGLTGVVRNIKAWWTGAREHEELMGGEPLFEATEVTKEMWDKEWNIKKSFGKEFEEKFAKRIEAAMSKAKNEEQAEEWAYKNFKQLPNPAKGMTIEESVMNEATVEVDAMFPTDKEFLKFLKKNKVKITNKEMNGPAGHPVITMQGKRKDLEKVLADPELGWDDPDLAEYIEESVEINERKAPFPYNLGFNGRNDHFRYAEEIGMKVKDIEGIRDYHKQAQRGGQTAVRDISGRILITTYGQPDIKDAIVKALKGVDKNLDLKTIKNNYDASDRERSKHEQDHDMWEWEIQKHEDVWSYKRKYGDAPKLDKEFTRDHQMEFIDMLAPYSTTQHELADIDITSLDSFLQYAADHVSSANLKKVTKRIKKEYPKLENKNINMKNLLTLESFSVINERKEKYPITDREDSDYKKLGAEWWFKCPFAEFKSRALGKPNFVTSDNVSDLDAEKWWRDQTRNHDGKAHGKILKMLDKYKGEYKGAGDRWEEFQSWIEQAMMSQGNMIDAR
jgi:hypothetical protein